VLTWHVRVRYANPPVKVKEDFGAVMDVLKKRLELNKK
jgi:hypothetical protein